MPIHPQPRELAELKGSIAKNPQRYRNEVPKHTGELGEPPKHMKAKAKKCWYELQTICIPATLTAAERLTFELLANFMVDYRADPTKFPAMKYPAMLGLMSRLGMNPADRQRIGVVAPKPSKEEIKFQ